MSLAARAESNIFLLQPVESVLKLFCFFWLDGILYLGWNRIIGPHDSLLVKKDKLVKIGLWSPLCNISTHEQIQRWQNSLVNDLGISTPPPAPPNRSLSPLLGLEIVHKPEGLGSPMRGPCGLPLRAVWVPAWPSCRCPRKQGQRYRKADLWGTWCDGHNNPTEAEGGGSSPAGFKTIQNGSDRGKHGKCQPKGET